MNSSIRIAVGGKMGDTPTSGASSPQGVGGGGGGGWGGCGKKWVLACLKRDKKERSKICASRSATARGGVAEIFSIKLSVTTKQNFC